jgi:hypothetical protein
MVNQDQADDRAVEEFLAVFNRQRKRITVLERQLDELRDVITALSSRMEVMHHLINQQRADVATEDSREHYRINDEFITLRDQTIHAAAQQIVNRGQSGRRDRNSVANAISKLCLALFDGPGPDRDALLEHLADVSGGPERAEHLYAKAEQLHAAANRAGDGRWDFETADVLDSTRQEPWLDSPPDGQIHFVVTPAYVAGQRIYSKQQVWTIEHRQAD